MSIVDDVVRVACIQMRPDVGENEQNLMRSLEFCGRAADAGARLVVLPELANSGYMFESRVEAWEAAEDVETGQTISAWADFCRERDIYLVGGFAERAGQSLFNSSAFLGPDGYIGTYRKVHLWNRENLFFEPGDLGYPVFNTRIGRLGSVICYDVWFPEAVRACALGGADILCVPTNWVPIPGQEPDAPAMATVLTQAGAHSNSMYVAAANRIGVERGQAFVGQSLVVNYTGWPMAGPASFDEEEILYADVDPGAARAARNWNDFNDPIGDRRPETYGAIAAT